MLRRYSNAKKISSRMRRLSSLRFASAYTSKHCVLQQSSATLTLYNSTRRTRQRRYCRRCRVRRLFTVFALVPPFYIRRTPPSRPAWVSVEASILFSSTPVRTLSRTMARFVVSHAACLRSLDAKASTSHSRSFILCTCPPEPKEVKWFLTR